MTSPLLELDLVRHTVVRDGRTLDLSAKEFGVLEAMLSARVEIALLQ